MNILVTGGAGFVGSHLIDKLVKQNHTITVLDNLLRGKIENINTHLKTNSINFLQADIRDYKVVLEAVKGCDYVFHLAAQSNVLGAVSDIRYSFETNVIGTFNLLLAAQKQGVKRVIFASSREVYGDALSLPVKEDHPLLAKNAYGASKAAAENYCRVFQNEQKVEVAILRLANVYGPRDFKRVIPIFIENAKKNRKISIYGGNQLIDFIKIPVVTEALIHSMENKLVLDGPVNVASGKGTTLQALAKYIKELTHSKSVIDLCEQRSQEVMKFTADVNRFKQVFKISLPTEPLDYIEDMFEI